MKLDVLNTENKKIEELEIDDKFFEIKVKDDLIHDMFLAYQQNKHIGSANTKTRGEVSGGGAKPWRQKGTGRARHGSISSPIWKGGGVVFGPKPKKVRYELNKKSKKKALQKVLASKISDKKIIVVNELKIEEGKTKKMAEIIKNLNLYGKKLLIVMDAKDEKLIKAARNIKNVKLLLVDNLNIYELLTYENVLLTKKSLEILTTKVA